MKKLFALLVILPYCAFGQSLYLSPNQSGTTIEASYSLTQEPVSSQGIEIGHSIGRSLDVGFRFGRDRLDQWYNTQFYGLSTSYYVLNADAVDGTVLSLDASYRWLNMRGWVYPVPIGHEGPDYHGDQYVFGGSAGERFQIAPNLTILPRISVGVRRTIDEIQSETDGFYGFAISWIVRTGSLTGLVLTPSVSVANDIGTFGLKAGVLFLQ